MTVDAAVPMVSRPDATSARIEAVYRAKHRDFLRVATAIAGTAEAGEDAVQEGLAPALARRTTFRGTGSLEAWLWRVIVNAARNARRRREPPMMDIPGSVEAGEPDEAIRAGVAALPERQRVVLFLRYYADLDYGTIARVLRIRRGTVSATLNHAHAAIRRLLEEDTSS
jgi:RNA polymerase sigma factor (sigma-70 family)